LPQVLKGVRYSGASPLDQAPVREVISAAEAELVGTGRLLIRKSGTEPVIRVMAEGEDEALVNRIVDDLCGCIRAAAMAMAAE
jgi:phosphoglucosamine mutase